MPLFFRRLCLIAIPLILTACSTNRPAGRAVAGEADLVASTVFVLFDAMRDGDAETLRRILSPDLVMTVVDSEGGVTVRPDAREGFVRSVASSQERLDERMWNPEVRIDGGMATLWAPYSFRRDGELTHCGFDAFQLARRDDRWVIVAIAYTRRSRGCEAFEPDSVAASTRR